MAQKEILKITKNRVSISFYDDNHIELTQIAGKEKTCLMISLTDKEVESIIEKLQNKELANWIYYEEGHIYYCYECVTKRVNEINTNKEFAEYINYISGDDCGYCQDYADEDYAVECCNCGKPLFSTGVDA